MRNFLRGIWLPLLCVLTIAFVQIPASGSEIAGESGTKGPGLYFGILHGHSNLSDGYFTPEELKKQGNCLAAYGVSHVVNHAVKMTREYAQSSVPPDLPMP